MKEEVAMEREGRLGRELKEFEYELINEDEFMFYGLSVIKFLKLFELDQEVVINHANHSSFLYYFKDISSHK